MKPPDDKNTVDTTATGADPKVDVTGTPGGQGGAAGDRGGSNADPKAKPAMGAKEPIAVEPVDDDDDEEALKPDDKGMLKPMRLKAFMRRVGQMTKKELRKNFGTDDVDKLVTDFKELPELRKYKESAEREKLSVTERLAKEKEDAEARAEAAEARASAVEMKAEAREYDSAFRAHAIAFLADKGDADYVLDKLARAVEHGEVKTRREAKEWVREFIEGRPKLKKEAADEKPGKKADEKKPAEEDKRKRIPLNSAGNRNAEKPKAADANGEQPDYRKMSKAEIQRTTGYKL